MMSKEELEKLTVLQLKEKLKSRKLALSGAKPDLITRLYENMLAEENLLGGAGLENDSVGTSEFDLSNVDVDEVLGMEPDILSPNIEKKGLDSKTDLSIEQTFGGVTAKTIEQPENKSTSSSKPLIVAPGASPKKTTSVTQKSLKVDEKPTTGANKNGGSLKDASNNGDADSLESKKASGLSAEEGQKLLLISKKLGLPCKNGASSSGSDGEDALAKRARRFGPVSEKADKKQSRLERFGLTAPPSADEKNAKQAEKVGENTSDQPEKKKIREARFGTANTADADKLQKRAERFGVASK